jgi:hypothetical protein
LFKAALGRAVFPQLEELQRLTQTFTGSSEEFLRGPFKEVLRHLVRSEARLLARVMLAEAHNFPDLTDFYYREVIQRGMAALHSVVAHGVARGEFRQTNLDQYPQPLVATAVVAMVWQSVLGSRAPLDVDGLVDTHVDLILYGLKARPEQSE